MAPSPTAEATRFGGGGCGGSRWELFAHPAQGATQDA
jgi:hypothetical protein